MAVQEPIAEVVSEYLQKTGYNVKLDIFGYLSKIEIDNYRQIIIFHSDCCIVHSSQCWHYMSDRYCNALCREFRYDNPDFPKNITEHLNDTRENTTISYKVPTNIPGSIW